MSFLIDTNVISEQRKRKPNEGVRRWFASTSKSQRYISVVSFGEVRVGIERKRSSDAAQAQVFEEWLQRLSIA